MSNGTGKNQSLVSASIPGTNQTFFNRPHWTRRQLLRTGGRRRDRRLPGRAATRARPKCPTPAWPPRAPRRTSSSFCWPGAPSHTDTFDLKTVHGVDPAPPSTPTTINGMPVAHRPDAEAGRADRRFRHRALHARPCAWCTRSRRPGCRSAATRWPRSATSRPTSAASWPSKRTRSASRPQIFPTFLALNSNGAVGPGLPPARVRAVQGDARTPAASPTPPTPTGQTRFENRLKLLHSPGRPAAHRRANGTADEDYDDFYARRQAVDVQPGGEPGSSASPPPRASATAPPPSATPAWWRRRC